MTDRHCLNAKWCEYVCNLIILGFSFIDQNPPVIMKANAEQIIWCRLSNALNELEIA